MTSRRELLGAIGLAVGVAGCSLPFGEDEPEPIEADHTELAAIADIDVPSVPDDPPAEIADSHVASQRERAESLLDPIPSDLATEIPNEAVRSYIAEERTRAREELDEATGSQSNYAATTTIANARRYAGEANGAYAAARGQRVREDVYEETESLRTRLSAVSGGLERVGDIPHLVALVYDTVEEHLDRANPEQRRIRQSPGVAETEAVGQASRELEYSRANLAIATHITDNRSGDSFDDEFERIASELVAGLDGRPGDFPAEPFSSEEAGKQLFDATVSDTPREFIVDRLYYTSTPANEIRRKLDDGYLGSALIGLSRYEHTRRTIESLQERIANGSSDRPADAAPIRRAKARAIAEIESVLTEPAYPELIRHHVQRPLSQIEDADRALEEGRETSLLDASAGYVLAAEQARTLPETVAWFVEQLP